MADKANNGEGDGHQEPEIAPEIVKLQEQIGNLNKGIASERREKEELKTNLSTLQTSFEELKSQLDSKDDKDDEVKLSPEDEKKLESWAKSKGFVSQAELTAEKQKLQLDSIKQIENQAVSEFLEKHPEYDSDENWQQVLSEFQLYRVPSTLDGYRKLLNKIHSDLSGDSKESDGRIKEKVENLNKSRLTLGGGYQGSGSDKDQEIEILQKRYPNLSKEQIVSRLTEIRSLYPKK